MNDTVHKSIECIKEKAYLRTETARPFPITLSEWLVWWDPPRVGEGVHSALLHLSQAAYARE
jgi:hypothetical protein